MKRKFTKLAAAFALIAALCFPLGMWGQDPVNGGEMTRTAGDEINRIADIDDGQTYYIKGWRNSGGSTLIEYLTFTDQIGNTQSGTSVSSTDDAIAVTFHYVSENTYTLQTATGHYFAPGTSNGKIKVSADPINVTVSNQTADDNNYIRLAITSGNDTWAIQKNKTAANFGGYKCTQRDITLIEAAGNVVATPTFSPVGGTYTQAQSVTISCATQGATISYKLNDGEWQTYSQALNITETTTVYAKATMTSMTESAVATATYTIEAPLATMQAIFDRATQIGGTEQNVNVTFGNWVVSGVGTDGKTVYVTDNAGKGFIIYKSSNGFSVNNKLSGTVNGTPLKLYKGAAEFTALTASTSGLTVTNDGEINVITNMTINDLAGVNTGAVVTLNNLTYSGTDQTLSDGEHTIKPYNTLFAYGSNTFVDGQVYNVTGVYLQFNDTKEILPRSAADIEEVVPTVPTITVTPATINAPFAGADGTLTVTYENITTVVAEVYFCDANGEAATYDWIQAEIDNDNNVYYVIGANTGEARTAYLKVWAYDDDMNEVYSDIVTINQAEYVAPTYAELPFEFNSGKAAIEETDGLSQEGLGSDYSSAPKLKFDDTGDWLLLQFSERPGTLTFDIKGNSFSGGTFTVQTSENGENYTVLATYTDLGNNTLNEEFNNLGENVRYIKWFYTNDVSGNVGLGNIALAKYEAPVPAITVESTTITATAAETEGTLTVTYENITTVVADVYFCNAAGTEASTYDWVTASVNETTNNVDYLIEENEGEARTAYFKVYAMDDESNLVYSNLVTITQAAPVAPPTPGSWVLTNLAELTSADVFVIVGTDEDTEISYALPNDGGTADAPSAIAVTVENNTLSGEIAESIQWNISGNATDGYTFYPVGSATTYLYCNTTAATKNNDCIRVGTGNTGRNKFVLNESDYLVTKDNYVTRYLSIYVTNGEWRGYVNTDNNPVAITFYKKVSDNVTFTKDDITAYTGQNDNYYLIASPVASVTPSANNGFLTDSYDLYRFSQSGDNYGKEWLNYKVETFDLLSGQGYLYANSTGADLTFTGQPYNGNGLVELVYDETAEFAGWNLIGNPFGSAATLDMPFYRMAEGGAGFTTQIEANSTVNAMEGVFVEASTNGETATFTAVRNSEPQGIAYLNINVNKNRGEFVDNAIVRFDGGQQLGKFSFRQGSTKVYMTENGKDYAIVRSAAEAEMPVSFRASENGTYTLAVEAENVEMNYLHLIDNLTGMDVDLLQTPSYTFDAKTSDYASRFRLVFKANGTNENNAETFAYFNGTNWTVSNVGDATLQVVDVTGRTVANQMINGNAELNLNQPAGVYVIRLVNGDNVKTQKVVVR